MVITLSLRAMTMGNPNLVLIFKSLDHMIQCKANGHPHWSPCSHQTIPISRHLGFHVIFNPYFDIINLFFGGLVQSEVRPPTHAFTNERV